MASVLLHAGAGSDVLHISALRINFVEVSIQRHGDECGSRTKRGRFAVVLVLKQLHRIREVREQFLNQLTLTFCYRTVSGQPLHSFTGSNVAHVPASFPGFDIAAFLYEIHHRLHRLLKVHRILERDAAIGPLHISDSPAAQTLICSFVNVGIISDDLRHQVDIHALLEKQRTDTACETVQRSSQRCRKYFGQKRTGVLRVQVADIEFERIHRELASAATVILLQMCVDLSVHILSDPESLFDLVVVFH